jgi:hypothetical protein
MKRMANTDNKEISDDVLTERKRCLDIVENTPLGYRSKEEHEILEWFVDTVSQKINSGHVEEWVHE